MIRYSMFWCEIVPKLNSASHSVDAVPGALPVGETGRALSEPSWFRMRSLPARGAAVEGGGGACPNAGGNDGVWGTLIDA